MGAPIKHGHWTGKRSSTYLSWASMKQRCDNPNSPAFSAYGGRGIKYDPSWDKFETFLADMGECPPELELDRIDNNKGYSKENCRWTTHTQNMFNQRIRCDNKSGIRGVKYSARDRAWSAWVTYKRETTSLYHGKDFFEACCARKSWEVHNL